MNVFGYLKELIKEIKSEKIEVKEAIELFKILYDKYDNVFLFESMENDNKLSRYSIIGFDPIAIITAHDSNVTIKLNDDTLNYQSTNPFLDLKELTNNDFDKKGFCGGLIGYVSYESIKYFEDVPTYKSVYPDFEFGLYLDCIIYDHIHNSCEYLTVNENRLEQIREMNDKKCQKKTLQYKLIEEDFQEEEYTNAVRKAKEHITNGDIFQAVISNPQNLYLEGNKITFYENLREINPSPYMYHIKFNQREIIGSSPEMLMRLEEDVIETYPIAGTRIRGKTEMEDKQLEKDLLNDEKELAEHLMLVDLARNDIGRISKTGSVNVDKFNEIKKFSHVQHIVSHVCAKLKEEYDAIDAFSSLFPAGTLSGAPKIRAMEIINNLEKTARGPYGGAVGYFSLNGDADFAITIRTLTTFDNRAEIQAGAGIVYDSDPEKEYEECRNKRRALLETLKISTQEFLK
ncbi:MAG: anthranilate synthase component I [Methanosphaera sp. rholeuAM130]|nr:MAG: anthranilate synthase component I [Methanosphaera sp. rholeuAM130]